MEIVRLQDCVPFITKDGSEIRELLSHRNSSISKQSLAEVRVPAGTTTALHRHPVTEEIYYILEGIGEMRIEDETFRVGPGTPSRFHRDFSIRSTILARKASDFCVAALQGTSTRTPKLSILRTIVVATTVVSTLLYGNVWGWLATLSDGASVFA